MGAKTIHMSPIRQCCFSKGQGATEYLVLLAVVLVIALVGIALLSFFPGTATDTSRISSETYWQDASPLGVHEAVQTASSSAMFSVENDRAGRLVLTGITLNGNAVAFGQNSSLSTSSRIPIEAGEYVNICIDDSTSNVSCNNSEYAQASLDFSFKDEYGQSIVQYGAKNVFLSCTNQSGICGASSSPSVWLGGHCTSDSNCLGGLTCQDGTCNSAPGKCGEYSISDGCYPPSADCQCCTDDSNFVYLCGSPATCDQGVCYLPGDWIQPYYGGGPACNGTRQVCTQGASCCSGQCWDGKCI
jgi:hypothetical protein